MKFTFHLSIVNGENNLLTPSILEIHRIGGIFIYVFFSTGFFEYARFVHSIRMDKVRLR